MAASGLTVRFTAFLSSFQLLQTLSWSMTEGIIDHFNRMLLAHKILQKFFLAVLHGNPLVCFGALEGKYDLELISELTEE